MDFKDIYSQMQSQATEILIYEAEKIKELIRDYMKTEIYKSYKPQVYNRTNELLNSVQIDYDFLGDRFEAKIYIPEDVLHSQSNWEGENTTLAGVAEYFASGRGYGVNREGKHLDGIEETYIDHIATGMILFEIIDMLRSKGFDAR